MAEEEDIFSDINSEEEEEGSGEDDDDPYLGDHGSNGIITKIIGSDRKFTPRMTSFEYARLVETRSEQIEAGSHVGIDPIKLGLTSSLDIAEEELKQGKCPLYVGKMSNDGKRMEPWHSSELQIMDSGDGLVLTPIEKIKDMSLDDILGDHEVWSKITKPLQKTKKRE